MASWSARWSHPAWSFPKNEPGEPRGVSPRVKQESDVTLFGRCANRGQTSVPADQGGLPGFFIQRTITKIRKYENTKNELRGARCVCEEYRFQFPLASA